MKHLNKLLVAILVIGLLSSCTQRRYGHITGFQLNKKAKTEKVPHSGHFVSPKKDINPSVADNTVQADISASDKIEEQPKLVNNTTPRKIKRVVSALATSNTATITKEALALPEIVNHTKEVTAPSSIVKNVKKTVAKKTKSGGLLYWILVVILLLLIIALLEAVLGQWLTRLLILIVLLVFVGHLLGLW